MLRNFYMDQKGGIVLEASLVLPVFLAFVMGLVICIQIALLEMALGAGVREATKTIAGQLYPVRLLVEEAKLKAGQTRPADILHTVMANIQSAKEQIKNAESLTDQYSAYIPEPLVELMKWEKEKRMLGEKLVSDGKESLLEEQLKPRLQALMTPIVYKFCNSRTIPKEGFKVTAVTLPSMESGGEAFLGIEAQITYKLPLPFISQTIQLKKKAFERAWVGV
ncbi:pilus assembly protein [Bacillus sp. 3255]|uniref:TadE/TadG family type IV pilus assembly protein n=1 Tax=Bacillus sp. 3255 TaxID=2817904 RepID=UPI00285C5662|nr:pilus assembly protein [Bacillus sp. 3255]MDR6882309.1 hypothetical protein [Bacillus sp. 3255]